MVAYYVMRSAKIFHEFLVPLNFPYFSALLSENLRRVDQKLVSVERFEVGNLRSAFLRKSTSKVSKLEKLLRSNVVDHCEHVEC